MNRFFDWVEARTGPRNPEVTRSYEFSVREQQDGRYSIGIGGPSAPRFVGLLHDLPEWLVPWVLESSRRGTGVLICDRGRWRIVSR